MTNSKVAAAVLAAPIPTTRRTVLLALTLRANRRGAVAVAMNELAQAAGVGVSTVLRSLADLEREGYVSRQRQRQRIRSGGTARAANRYTLNLDRLAA